MKWCHQPLRFLRFILLLILCAMSSFAITIFSRDKWERRRRLAKVVSFYSHLTLKLLGVQTMHKFSALKFSNIIPNRNFDNFLIVANHISYLDILVISSLYPCVFVTSQEIRDTPFLGFLSGLAGCLYVERRSRQNQNQEIRDITEALQQGLNVCIFPEATSTNGDSVLRFRRPLFQAAIESRKKVLPLCLNYRFIDGEKVSLDNRDIIAWYGDMDFLPHLWSLMGATSIQVELSRAATLGGSNYHAQELAEAAHFLVAKNFTSFKVNSLECKTESVYSS